MCVQDTAASRSYLLSLFQELAKARDCAQHQRTLCLGALVGLRARDSALRTLSAQLLDRTAPRSLLALNVRLLLLLAPSSSSSISPLSSASASASESAASQTQTTAAAAAAQAVANADDTDAQCARVLGLLEAAHKAPVGALVGRRPVPVLAADVIERLDRLFAGASAASGVGTAPNTFVSAVLNCRLFSRNATEHWRLIVYVLLLQVPATGSCGERWTYAAGSHCARSSSTWCTSACFSSSTRPRRQRAPLAARRLGAMAARGATPSGGPGWPPPPPRRSPAC